MCNVCLKEFKGWCKSFTIIEAILSILEGFLLILVFGLLVFLILHFLACTNDDIKETIYNVETTTTTTKTTTYRPNTNVQTTLKPTIASITPFPLVPVTKCTWKPSEKTKAHIKYYEYNTTTYKESKSTSDYKDSSERDKEIAHPTISIIDDHELNHSKQPDIIELENTDVSMKTQYILDHADSDFLFDESDGEDAEDFYQQYVLALVKVNPPRDIIFGCILTVVTEYWTITSASCIETIEEIDSLDSFVMMEDYGKVRKGRSHVISDVQIHPMYEGVNKSYDLAALKSEESLMKGSGFTVDLPSLIDYFMITIGERFVLLGYGPYRTIDTGPHGKRLHKVYVYSLPSKQCPQQSEWWSLRHLWDGAASPGGRLGVAPGPACCGSLWARGSPCNYCGGAPLLRGSILFGIMSDNPQCGVACEPQLYVNIAVLRDWLEFVTGTK